jgi:DNA-binding GntR family transcriptional regulator
VWQQLVVDLRSRIQSGEIPPGSALPREQTLSVAYSVARGTVRKALDELSRQGTIRTRRGSG